MTYPDWLPLEAWEGFKAMRKTIKKPMTARAETMAIKMLDTLRLQGENVELVLMQSEYHGWQGLFAVKPEFRQQITGDTRKGSEFLDKISDRTWAH